MIKEKDNTVKFETKLLMELASVAKTIGLSLIFATVFTICLTINARSTMIKNLYAEANKDSYISKQLAQQILAHNNVIFTLETKTCSFCMQIGKLYETIKDYKNAEYAYYLAVKKSKHGNYAPQTKLVQLYANQEKFEEAEKIIQSVDDANNEKIIKFKTRAYIDLGDKYYSIGKYISSAKNYEKAQYYYSRLNHKDIYVENSIKNRIINAYDNSATILVKNGYNSDAVRLLNKAKKYFPDSLVINYKLAIIYSDLDPEVSVKYFEDLAKKIPQKIDYNIYNKALIKSANIADITGDEIKAKYYRYKIHSNDLFVMQKVLYPSDVNVYEQNYKVTKRFFKYHISGTYSFQNVSNENINRMYADFVLRQGDKNRETYTVLCADKKNPLISNGTESNKFNVKLGRNILTKKELKEYYLDIYLYKDKKFKTLVSSRKIL